MLVFALGVLVPTDFLGVWWWLAAAAFLITLAAGFVPRRAPVRPDPGRATPAPTPPPVPAEQRTDLIAAVSHDLRTPLATIGAYVELLEAGEGGELSGEQLAMLDVVDQNLKRAYDITDDLLDLGRGPAGRPEPVTIGDVLRDAVHAAQPAAHERGQHLSLESHLDGVLVAGSARQLDRILANLLSNAVKFTPDGGSVTVFGRLEHGRVLIGVTDTGAGIPRAEQQRIFERYYRSDTARARRVPGTGLGLSIVRELAALHGGQVDVRSTPGHGATFTLALPAMASAA